MGIYKDSQRHSSNYHPTHDRLLQDSSTTSHHYYHAQLNTPLFGLSVSQHQFEAKWLLKFLPSSGRRSSRPLASPSNTRRSPFKSPVPMRSSSTSSTPASATPTSTPSRAIGR